jgi:hypothetical protein
MLTELVTRVRSWSGSSPNDDEPASPLFESYMQRARRKGRRSSHEGVATVPLQEGFGTSTEDPSPLTAAKEASATSTPTNAWTKPDSEASTQAGSPSSNLSTSAVTLVSCFTSNPSVQSPRAGRSPSKSSIQSTGSRVAMEDVERVPSRQISIRSTPSRFSSAGTGDPNSPLFENYIARARRKSREFKAKEEGLVRQVSNQSTDSSQSTASMASE